ncbi:MAG: trypsin-like peptidase domain-containing protein [Leptospiraceae bacterium]|nr:trypsin-like peptidase domain-containing protein [Leptospiraceae bacterium]MCK6380413.1 trypsin-like peptidase domain-containing protein [Leptospiraceae bacterium]
MERFKNISPLIYINSILLIVLFLLIYHPGVKNRILSITAKETKLSKTEQNSAVQIQKVFRSVYSLTKDSVVSIRTTQDENLPYFYEGRENEISALGSGFIIDYSGHILTNYHVIKMSKSIEVILPNGRTEKAEFIGSHERADLALLKIPNSEGLKPVTFGNSDEVEVGDWAIAIGSPFGLEKTFTVGVVSAKSRADLDETGQSHIQTDTAINPGNSGGPLLNINGEVIGINRLIRSNSGSSSGIAFAIPINYAKKILEMIKENPKVNIRPATLGVVATAPPTEHKRALGIPVDETGVLVYGIEPFSSANRGGLQRFDLIQEVNGSKILSIRELREEVSLAGLGGKLKIQVLRKGKKITIQLKLIHKQ